MSVIAWIGLGKMGLPMAQQLLKAGHSVRGVEINPAVAKLAEEAGIPVFSAWTEAIAGADAVITMLPTGQHVRDLLTGAEGLFATVTSDVIVIDSSTIDTGTAQELHVLAAARDIRFVDAPVSGGVGGAAAGTLTFMVGGTEDALSIATPIIEPMAAKIVHTGIGGTGQAAKIVNNMIFGVCLAATCEGVLLGTRLGLDPAVFYQIATSSSGDNFPLRNWYPAPGVVESAPSSHDYEPGFTSALLLKDLTLAVQAGEQTGTELNSASVVQKLYAQMVEDGGGALDCTALLPSLAGDLVDGKAVTSGVPVRT